MANDIDIRVGIKGGDDIAKLARNLNSLDRNVKTLATSFDKGKINNQAYFKGLNQQVIALTKLGVSYKAAQKHVFSLASATRQTTVASTQQTKVVRTLTTATNGAAAAAIRLANSQRLAGKTTNRFGANAQQVGYQVGDFFVQVQSGADALIAFGQQGTQLAGLLPGLGGAIIGIGLSLATAFGVASLKSRGLTIDFKEVGSALKKSLDPIKPIVDLIGRAFDSVGGAISAFGQSVLDNFDRVVVYASTLVLLLGVKLVAGFIMSGKAASAFFKLVKAGLISTGIGALVVVVGELILRFTRLVKETGSFGAALGAIKNVVGTFWDYLGAKIDVALDKFKLFGASFESFMLGILNVVMDKIQTSINFMIQKLNDMFSSMGTTISVPLVNFTGQGSSISNALTSAQNRVAQNTTSLQTNQNTAAALQNQLVGEVSNLLGLTAGGNTSVDTSKFLKPDDGKGKDKKTFGGLLKELEAENEQRAKLVGVYGEQRVSLEEIYSMETELERKLTEQEKLKLRIATDELYRLEKLEQAYDLVTSGLESAFMSMVEGSKSVVEAFKGMMREILLEVYRQQVAKPLASAIGSAIFGSADGNVFSSGSHVKAYANGGVVNGPT
jgi:hypothetical protein